MAHIKPPSTVSINAASLLFSENVVSDDQMRSSASTATFAMQPHPVTSAEDFVCNPNTDVSVCVSHVNSTAYEATVSPSVIDGSAVTCSNRDEYTVAAGDDLEGHSVECESDTEEECTVHPSYCKDVIRVSHVGQCTLSQCSVDLSASHSNIAFVDGSDVISIASSAACNQRSISPIDIT